MVAEALKRQLRSVQTFAPGIRALKFASYNWATRNFGWRVEPEFKLLGKLGPCSLAIDVGGNWGQSIYAFRRYAKPENIISFEPNAQLSALLKTQFAGQKSVTIQPYALGVEADEFELHVPSYRGFVYDGLASLDRESAAQWLNQNRMARFDPDKLKIHSTMVSVKTLDSFGLSPDIIKIDVQGFEEAVVKGATETIARTQPVCIIEDPSSSLVQLLAGLGLEQYGLSGGKLLKGHADQSNSLFLNHAKHALLAS